MRIVNPQGSSRAAEATGAGYGAVECPAELGVGKIGEGHAGGAVMGSGLLEGVEDVLLPAGGAVEAGKEEAGLSGADVVARAGEGLFCRRDGVAEAMCLGV